MKISTPDQIEVQSLMSLTIQLEKQIIAAQWAQEEANRASNEAELEEIHLTEEIHEAERQIDAIITRSKVRESLERYHDSHNSLFENFPMQESLDDRNNMGKINLIDVMLIIAIIAIVSAEIFRYVY